MLIGEVVMSEDLEKLGNFLFDNQVPEMWEDVGFYTYTFFTKKENSLQKHYKTPRKIFHITWHPLDIY